MTVYIVVQMTVLGAISITGVYEDEMMALRQANESTLRKVIPMELIRK